MKVLGRIAALFDHTTNILAFFAALVLVFLMLSVALGVVMRYFLEQPLLWVIQIGEYCLLYITLLSAVWLLKREGHVTMDLVVERLTPGLQRGIKILTSTLGSILCFGLFLYGAGVTWDAYQRGRYPSQAVLEIPDAYILVVIPVIFFMLSVQFMRTAYGLWRERKEEHI